MHIDGENEDHDDELLLDNEAPESEIEDGQEAEAEPSEVRAEPEVDGDGLVIEIEGEAADETDTPVIRRMREELRKAKREAQELRAQSAPKPIEVGPEPKWDDGADWDYDAEKFFAEKSKWDERRRAAETQQQDQTRVQEQARQRWETAQTAYQMNAAKLGVPKYQEAHDAVGSALPGPVGQVVVQYFGEDGPKVVLALHRNPAVLDRIVEKAKDDPLAAIFELHDLRRSIKVNKRTAPPPPTSETKVRGTIVPQSADKRLAALEKEAERTGDRTKVIEHKRAMRTK